VQLQQRAAKEERRLINREQRAESRVEKARVRLIAAEERLARAQARVDRRASRLADAVAELRRRQEERADGPRTSGETADTNGSEVAVVDSTESVVSDQGANPPVEVERMIDTVVTEPIDVGPKRPPRRRTRRPATERTAKNE
jgi:hypothetical protein